MKRRFENADDALSGDHRGTLKRDPRARRNMSNQMSNEGNNGTEEEEEYITDAEEDVTQQTPSNMRDGDKSMMKKLKQISIEEDGHTTWRQPRDTIAESKMSVANAGLSSGKTGMNWDVLDSNLLNQ